MLTDKTITHAAFKLKKRLKKKHGPEPFHVHRWRAIAFVSEAMDMRKKRHVDSPAAATGCSRLPTATRAEGSVAR